MSLGSRVALRSVCNHLWPAALALLIGCVSTAAADSLIGHWYTEDNESIVVITQGDDGTYSGMIVWLDEPYFSDADDVGPERWGDPKADLYNPDPDVRETPIIGLTILRGFTQRADDRWDGGTIYDPNNGRTYRCIIRIDGPNRLRVRGYVGISAFGRSTEWQRVPPDEVRAHLHPEEGGEPADE